MFIKKKTSKLRISKNDLFMNQKRHISQKGGSIAPNDPPRYGHVIKSQNCWLDNSDQNSVTGSSQPV